MTQLKVNKNRLRVLFALTIFLSFNHFSHALAGQVDKEKAQVDTVTLEVQKISSLEEAETKLDETRKTLTMYYATLRQLGKGMGFEGDNKGLQDAVESTKELIQQYRRKEQLLLKKIEELKA